MNLREAAQLTSRSVTTLRRYVRSGRLRAEKRQGRFGPEYFVSERDLTEAGLETGPAPRTNGLARRATRRDLSAPRRTDRTWAEAVPIALYQELQMKHEQLLVQYGMVRASGRKLFDLQADLEARQRELADAKDEIERLRRQLAEETGRRDRQSRRAALEQQGQELEAAALKEKLRALEMFNRNARTSDSIEQQFRSVMEQSRRVERLSESRPAEGRKEPPGGPDH